MILASLKIRKESTGIAQWRTSVVFREHDRGVRLVGFRENPKVGAIIGAVSRQHPAAIESGAPAVAGALVSLTPDLPEMAEQGVGEVLV